MHLDTIGWVLVTLIVTCVLMAGLVDWANWDMGGDPYNKWFYRAGWSTAALAAMVFYQEGYGLLFLISLPIGLLVFLFGFLHNRYMLHTFCAWVRQELKDPSGHLTSQDMSDAFKLLHGLPKKVAFQEAADVIKVYTKYLEELIAEGEFPSIIKTPEGFRLPRRDVILCRLKMTVRVKEASYKVPRPTDIAYSEKSNAR